MFKKINETFGSKTVNAKNMWAIFGITTLVASIAAVTGLSGAQTASAETRTVSCEVVKITSPADGTRVGGWSTTFKGYAKYGSSYCMNDVPGSSLKWFKDGVFVGTGKSILIEGFKTEHGSCGTKYAIKLLAEIPTPSKHTISTTISVLGPCVG